MEAYTIPGTKIEFEKSVEAAHWELIQKITKEKIAAAKLMTPVEGRFLVHQYYAMQHFRIESDSRIRSMDGLPNEVAVWLADQMRALENDIKNALKAWAREYKIGQWLQSICGIGPVISAGTLAHLDIRKAKTAGHFWSFAGFSGQTWEKGQKRPWNAELKTLMAFKAGECFVKVQGRKNDYYGKLFKERKLAEIEKNEAGENREVALERSKKVGKTTDAYKAYIEGRLPPAHVHSRARRWVVKLFMSHIHHAMYVDYYGKEPPQPYSFSEHCKEDHRHFIDLPNWPFETKGAKSMREFFGEKD